MHPDLPELPAPTGGIIVLEAPAGRSRRRLLQAWAGQAEARGASSWVLPCGITEAGLWAGVNTLFASLLPALRETAPELVDEHAMELWAVLPETGPDEHVQETLTEAASGVEAVRNYALDRAYRIPQGLVDLLDGAFRQLPSPGGRVMLCDDYDRCGSLVRRFFHELVRRRGEAFGLTLVVAVDPGGADAIQAQLGDVAAIHRVQADLPADADAPRTPAEATRLARELDTLVRTDTRRMEVRIPELVDLWLRSEKPQNARVWQAFAMARYNHRGFYEDALVYAEHVMDHLDEIVGQRHYFSRWNLVGAIFGCLIQTGQVERGYRIVKEEALDKIFTPADRPRILYVMSMLHARFLPERDLDKADAYLQEGLSLLGHPEIDDETRHFLHVFLNNGLALVRHRQGRPDEAVRLCQEGFAHLDEHMTEERHRLHRSVLLYNIAQVYTATGALEQAVEYFGRTIQMDPNYSEYYNERGNVLQKLGRLEEAVSDYRTAIRLSPPYHEVWMNLGQCLRRLGRNDEAVEAYARAIDLEPGQLASRVGLAMALDALGRRDEALAAYDAALEREPAQPLVLANRAAARYAAGRAADAAGDLDRAIALAPTHPGLYRNRSMALADLGRGDEAARDLATYLELVPQAPDRAEVEQRIAELRGALAVA